MLFSGLQLDPLGRATAMHFLLLTTTLLMMGGLSAGMEHFLDCSGNYPNLFQKMVRRCCKDKQLPNGCECFSIESRSGFTNSRMYMPECPSTITPRFLLYTRNNRNDPDIIRVDDGSISRSNFQSGKPIKFIVHGFTDKAPNSWSEKMANALLDKEDVNVVLVDWQKGARITFYLYISAVANVRTVGAMMAKLITDLADDNKIPYDRVHCIGHSLGAHACGMAAKEIYRLTGSKVARISGLDPAGPLYEDAQTHVRLDKSDAIFVDVIHTDAANRTNFGFGISKSLGQVDFWPNGGHQQPGCPEENLSNFIEWVKACSHLRALDLYTNSLTDCQYEAGSGCKMGYYANSIVCDGNIHTILTDSMEPYCKQ